MKLPCKTPTCTGTYDQSPYARNKNRMLGLCKLCRKEYARLYQIVWRIKKGYVRPPGKHGGHRLKKIIQQEAKDPGLNRDGKPVKRCKTCGEDAWPNYNYCPPCHSRRSRLGDLDEHALPHGRGQGAQ